MTRHRSSWLVHQANDRSVSCSAGSVAYLRQCRKRAFCGSVTTNGEDRYVWAPSHMILWGVAELREPNPPSGRHVDDGAFSQADFCAMERSRHDQADSAIVRDLCPGRFHRSALADFGDCTRVGRRCALRHAGTSLRCPAPPAVRGSRKMLRLVQPNAVESDRVALL